MSISLKFAQNSDPDSSPTVATGSTAATEVSEIIPTGDAFVCGTCRVAARVASKGLRVRISTAGVMGTTGTIKGTMSIKGANGNTLVGPLTIVDWPNAVNPAIGTVKATSSVGDVLTADPGELCEVVWNETGDIGDGTRPNVQILSWGWYVVDDGVIS